MRQNWRLVLNGLGIALCLVRQNLFFQMVYIFCLRRDYEESKRVDNFHAVITCAKDMAVLTVMMMIKKYLDIGVFGGSRGSGWSLGGYA